jgi:hypothetical protein
MSTSAPHTAFVDPAGGEPICRICGKLSHGYVEFRACLAKLPTYARRANVVSDQEPTKEDV